MPTRCVLTSLVLLAVLVGCPRRQQPLPSKPTQISGGSDAAIPSDHSAASPASTQNDAPESKIADSAERSAKEKEVPDKALVADDVPATPPDSVAKLPGSQSVDRPGTNETWSVQRYIVLASGGPLILDLSINVQGKSLMEAYHQRLDEIAQELKVDLSGRVAWTDILAQPLIQSGWLGNLVPKVDTQEQILNLYDQGRDNQANRDELLAFFSRGLTRGLRIGVSEVSSSDTFESTVFGPCDLDGDGELSPDEVQQIEKSLMRFDFNGDLVVNRQELAGNKGGTNEFMNSPSTSMIASSTLLAWKPTESTASASSVLQHYTFLDQISRESWFAWPTQRWQGLDANGDMQLNRSELMRLSEVPSHLALFVRLPHFTSSHDESISAKNSQSSRLDAELNLPSALGKVWSNRGPGSGQLATESCNMYVNVDRMGSEFKDQFIERLRAGLNESQLAMQLRNQFELGESGIQFADADGNSELSEAEGDSAWKWFSIFRQLRISGRWQPAQGVLFELLDQDQNRVITQAEILQLNSAMSHFDANKDTLISSHEVPLVVRFDIVSLLSTQFSSSLGAREEQPSKPNSPRWFAAMDSNQDGGISRLEFLGESAIFIEMDDNKDGIISPFEVYETR